MQDNPIEDLEALISYLSMTDEEKALEVAYSFGWVIVHQTNTIEDLLDREDLPENVRRELENFDPEDEQLGDLGDEIIEEVAKAVDVDEVLQQVAQHWPEEYPLWADAELRQPGIQEGWLVRELGDDYHYEKGFQDCVDDLRMLNGFGYLSSSVKSSEGYSFSYRLEDYVGGNRQKKRLVLFRAPYVCIWHFGSGEPQAIFWGPDATNRYEVLEEHGFYTVLLDAEERNQSKRSTQSGRPMNVYKIDCGDKVHKIGLDNEGYLHALDHDEEHERVLADLGEEVSECVEFILRLEEADEEHQEDLLKEAAQFGNVDIVMLMLDIGVEIEFEFETKNLKELADLIEKYEVGVLSKAPSAKN